MVKVRRHFFALVFLLAPLLAFAKVEQKTENSFLCLGTGSGVIIGSNVFDVPFTAEVKFKSKKVQTAIIDEAPGVMVTGDGLAVQMIVLEIKKFYEGPLEKLGSDELFRKHMEWEVGYQGEQLGLKFKPTLATSKSKAGREIGFWSYEIPKSRHKNKPDAIKYNLAAVSQVQKYLVVFTVALSDSKDLKESWGKIWDAALSIKEQKERVTAAQMRKLLE